MLTLACLGPTLRTRAFNNLVCAHGSATSHTDDSLPRTLHHLSLDIPSVPPPLPPASETQSVQNAVNWISHALFSIHPQICSSSCIHYLGGRLPDLASTCLKLPGVTAFTHCPLCHCHVHAWALTELISRTAHLYFCLNSLFKVSCFPVPAASALIVCTYDVHSLGLGCYIKGP